MRGLSRSARMALRRQERRKEAGELNLVSFIDILTVLVFFLLVNITGIAVLGINLPDANAQPSQEENQRALAVVVRPTELTLTQGGKPLSVFGASTSDLQALRKTLVQIKNRNPQEMRITLQVDAATHHDLLVQVMDTVRLTPSADGRQLYELFPAIALGDAPVAAAGVSP